MKRFVVILSVVMLTVYSCAGALAETSLTDERLEQEIAKCSARGGKQYVYEFGRSSNMRHACQIPIPIQEGRLP